MAMFITEIGQAVQIPNANLGSSHKLQGVLRHRLLLSWGKFMTRNYSYPQCLALLGTRCSHFFFFKSASATCPGIKATMINVMS